jgi:hypothetical protein
VEALDDFVTVGLVDGAQHFVQVNIRTNTESIRCIHNGLLRVMSPRKGGQVSQGTEQCNNLV